MLFNVPQYIDVEDKVVGPLTIKQMGWLFAMSGILLLLYMFLEKAAFYLIAIPVIMLFAALAFYKPFKQPLLTLFINGIGFISRPKLYTWRRDVSRQEALSQLAPTQKKQEDVRVSNKQIDFNEIHGLAQLIDSKGKERNPDTVDFLKKKKYNN